MGERNGHALDPQEVLLGDLEHFGEALHRNEEMGEKRLATDEFKATMKVIRQEYATRAGSDGYDPLVETRKLPRGFRGGYAETIAMANGGLAFTTLFTSGIPGAYTALVAGLVAVVLWTLAAQRRA